MPPNKKHNGHKAPNVTAPDGSRYREHTTSRGVTIQVSAEPPLMRVGIRSALEQEWQAKGWVLPERPTYEIKTAAGNVETHEHDEITIKGNAEAEAAWAEWKEQTDKFNAEFRESSIRSVILECVEFETDPSWKAKNKARRVPIPADEFERKLYFAYTEVFGHQEDYQAVMLISAELAGATEQQITAIREAFLNPVENTGRPKARRLATKAGEVVAE